MSDVSTPPSSAAPSERRCYPFVQMNPTYGRNLQIYSGLIRTLGPLEPVPDNASIFQPPTAPVGSVVYWAGHGWAIAVDVRTLPLARLSALCVAALDARFKLNTDSLSQGYTSAEMWTWASQENDARAFLATGVNTYLLRQLAAANNYTVEILCQRILAKAEAYRAAYSDVLAMYQNTKNTLQAATTADQLPPLNFADLRRVLGTGAF